MDLLEEKPKGKMDYDHWICDGTILIRGIFKDSFEVYINTYNEYNFKILTENAIFNATHFVDQDFKKANFISFYFSPQLPDIEHSAAFLFD